MKTQHLCAGLAVISLAAVARTLDAGTIYGDTVSAKWSYDSSPATFAFSGTAVAGPATEFVTEPSTGYVNEADFAESAITVRYRRSSGSGSFSAKHWFFESVDFLPPAAIINVVPNPGNPAGATVSNIGPNSFRIGLPGLSVTSPNIVSWSFNIVTVPEPSTGWLLSIGIFGIFFGRRKPTFHNYA
jgi:hypothetical protein